MKNIDDFYNKYNEGERLFQSLGRLEFTRTCDIINRYLGDTGETILDIGGATGHYSFWLAEKGYQAHLIDIVEKTASCELYGLLKRPDEKHVTERAYNNPKFVEDMVRDIAVQLNNDKRITYYVVESENFESIHNHSAYALIEKDKTAS